MAFLYSTRLALRVEFFLSGFSLFLVEQFVAHLAKTNQIVQVVEFVSLVFVGAVVGLEF
jgi:hypothetical protein